MPRFHVLTAGFKAPVTTSSVLSAQTSTPSMPSPSPNTNAGSATSVPGSSFLSGMMPSLPSGFSFFSAQPSLASLGSSTSGAPPNISTPGTMLLSPNEIDEDDTFQKRRDKRKSRLGTSEHLSEPVELQEDDNNKIFREGPLSWSAAVNLKGKKGCDTYYFVLRNGEMQRFVDQNHFQSGKRPIGCINIANARASIASSPSSPNGKQLRVTLIEDEELHIFEGQDEHDLDIWKIQILKVSRKWGEVQKVQMEHEVAYLRKQLGALWELCSSGSEIPAKIQKRINDITADIQVKDALLGDMADRQDEFALMSMDQGQRKVSMRARADFDDDSEVTQSLQPLSNLNETPENVSSVQPTTEKASNSNEVLNDKHSVLESTYILMEASNKTKESSRENLTNNVSLNSPTIMKRIPAGLEETTPFPSSSSSNIRHPSNEALPVKAMSLPIPVTPLPASPLGPNHTGTGTQVPPAVGGLTTRRRAGTIAKQMEKELLLKADSMSPRTQRKSEQEKHQTHEKQTSRESPFKPSPFEASPDDASSTNNDGSFTSNYHAYRRRSRQSSLANSLQPPHEEGGSSLTPSPRISVSQTLPEAQPSKVNPFEAPTTPKIDPQTGSPVLLPKPNRARSQTQPTQPHIDMTELTQSFAQRSSRRTAMIIAEPDKNVSQEASNSLNGASNENYMASNDAVASTIDATSDPPNVAPVPTAQSLSSRRSSRRTAMILPVAEEEQEQKEIQIQNQAANIESKGIIQDHEVSESNTSPFNAPLSRRSSRRRAVGIPVAEDEVPQISKEWDQPPGISDRTELVQSQEENNYDMGQKEMSHSSNETKIKKDDQSYNDSDSSAAGDTFHQNKSTIDVIHEEDEENVTSSVELLGNADSRSKAIDLSAEVNNSPNIFMDQPRSNAGIPTESYLAVPQAQRKSKIGIDLTIYMQSLVPNNDGVDDEQINVSEPTDCDVSTQNPTIHAISSKNQEHTPLRDEADGHFTLESEKKESLIESNLSEEPTILEDTSLSLGNDASHENAEQSILVTMAKSEGNTIREMVATPEDHTASPAKKIVVITRKSSNSSMNSAASISGTQSAPLDAPKRISIMSNPENNEQITIVTNTNTSRAGRTSVIISPSANGVLPNSQSRTSVVLSASSDSVASHTPSSQTYVRVPRNSIPPPPPLSQKRTSGIQLQDSPSPVGPPPLPSTTTVEAPQASHDVAPEVSRSTSTSARSSLINPSKLDSNEIPKESGTDLTSNVSQGSVHTIPASSFPSLDPLNRRGSSSSDHSSSGQGRRSLLQLKGLYSASKTFPGSRLAAIPTNDDNVASLEVKSLPAPTDATSQVSASIPVAVEVSASNQIQSVVNESQGKKPEGPAHGHLSQIESPQALLTKVPTPAPALVSSTSSEHEIKVPQTDAMSATIPLSIRPPITPTFILPQGIALPPAPILPSSLPTHAIPLPPNRPITAPPVPVTIPMMLPRPPILPQSIPPHPNALPTGIPVRPPPVLIPPTAPVLRPGLTVPPPPTLPSGMKAPPVLPASIPIAIPIRPPPTLPSNVTIPLPPPAQNLQPPK